MKTIKHPDTYICEICNTEYDLKLKAKLCEDSLKLPEPLYKIDDKILVIDRYDNIEECVIKRIEIALNAVGDVLKHIPYKDNVYGFKTNIEKNEKFQSHEYLYVVDKEIQTGKSFYTYSISSSNIIICGYPTELSSVNIIFENNKNIYVHYDIENKLWEIVTILDITPIKYSDINTLINKIEDKLKSKYIGYVDNY